MALGEEHYQGLAEFRHALRRFVAASETISRRAGVTQQQYQALLAIRTWPTEALAMKAFAEQLLLTHHAAVQLVNRLAALGLAVREPSPEDGRSVLVRLTPNGRSLLDDLAARHHDEIQRQEPLLTRSLRRIRSTGS